MSFVGKIAKDNQVLKKELIEVIAAYENQIIESLKTKLPEIGTTEYLDENQESRKRLNIASASIREKLQDTKAKEGDMAYRIVKSTLYKKAKNKCGPEIENYRKEIFNLWKEFTDSKKPVSKYSNIASEHPDINETSIKLAHKLFDHLIENNFRPIEAFCIVDKATRFPGNKVKSHRKGTSHEDLGIKILPTNAFEGRFY